MDKKDLWDKNSSLGLSEVGYSLDTGPESSGSSRTREQREVLSYSPCSGGELTLPSVQLKFYRSTSAPAQMLSTHSRGYRHQDKDRTRGGFLAPVSKPAYQDRSPQKKLHDKSSRSVSKGRLRSELNCLEEALPRISLSSPSVKTAIMDRLPLEVRCDYCGQFTAKETLSRHTNWCMRQRQLKNKPDHSSVGTRERDLRPITAKSKPDRTTDFGESANDAVAPKKMVARVVTLGLEPGKIEQVFFYSQSQSDKSERPKTRTLRQSSLQNSGYGLPSLDRAVEGQQGDASGSQAPHMERCKNCNMIISSDRIGVHQRLCKSPQISTGVVQIPSTHNLLRVDSKNPSEGPSHSSRPPRKPPTVACYVCGREYGSKSLPIHEPQCLKKFHAQNDKLPINERLPVPRKSKSSAVARILLREEEQVAVPSLPDGIYRNVAPSGDLAQQFFEHCYSEFEKELIPCKKCGRTFAPERHIHHEPNCNAKPLKML